MQPSKAQGMEAAREKPPCRRVPCEHKDPTRRRKIRTNVAKDSGRGGGGSCPFSLSDLPARKADGDCDLLTWFLEGKSFIKDLLAVDFAPDVLGWI